MIEKHRSNAKGTAANQIAALASTDPQIGRGRRIERFPKMFGLLLNCAWYHWSIYKRFRSVMSRPQRIPGLSFHLLKSHFLLISD